jgi:hypothetical protein
VLEYNTTPFPFISGSSIGLETDGAHGTEGLGPSEIISLVATVSTPPQALVFATPPSTPDPELLDAAADPELPHRYIRVADLLGPGVDASQAC